MSGLRSVIDSGDAVEESTDSLQEQVQDESLLEYLSGGYLNKCGIALACRSGVSLELYESIGHQLYAVKIFCKRSLRKRKTWYHDSATGRMKMKNMLVKSEMELINNEIIFEKVSGTSMHTVRHLIKEVNETNLICDPPPPSWRTFNDSRSQLRGVMLVDSECLQQNTIESHMPLTLMRGFFVSPSVPPTESNGDVGDEGTYYFVMDYCALGESLRFSPVVSGTDENVSFPLFVSPLISKNDRRLYADYVLGFQTSDMDKLMMMGEASSSSTSILTRDPPFANPQFLCVPYPEFVCASFLRDISFALHLLHRNTPTIAHCDVKPQNVLLNTNGRAQLGDFGSSRVAVPADSSACILKRSECEGTETFWAPETVKIESPQGSGSLKSQPPAQYDAIKADIWALGLTFFVWLFGYIPVLSVNKERMYASIETANVEEWLNTPMPAFLCPDNSPTHNSLRVSDGRRKSDHVSPGARALLKAMLAHNPNDRPSSLEIYNSEYLRKVDTKKVEEWFSKQLRT